MTTKTTMENPKTKDHVLSVRMRPEMCDKLEKIRVDHGLRSWNAAVKMLIDQAKVKS